MIYISIIHLVVVAVAIFVAWSDFRRTFSLLSFTFLGLLFLDSGGLVLVPHLPDGIYLPYVLDTTFSTSPLISAPDSHLYLRQVIAHWCFLTIPLTFLCGKLVANILTSKSSRFTLAPDDSVTSYGKWSCLAISVLLSVKFYVFGPGIAILMDSQFFFDAASDAINSRRLGKDILDVGQGAFMALVAARLMLPLGACLALQNRQRRDWFVFSLCSLGSMAYAIQTRQKSPVVITLVIYTLIALLSKVRPAHLLIVLRSSLLYVTMFVLCLVLAASTYVLNYGQSVGLALASAFARLLVVPCISEANFFSCFPEDYPFRGWVGVFTITLGHWGSTQDVTIYDVALAASGSAYSANASALAVAWSGSGYPGIVLVSAIVTVSLALLDRVFAAACLRTKVLALTLSVPSLIGLVSGGFADYVTSGGLVLPLLLYVALRYLCKGLSSELTQSVF